MSTFESHAKWCDMCALATTPPINCCHTGAMLSSLDFAATRQAATISRLAETLRACVGTDAGAGLFGLGNIAGDVEGRMASERMSANRKAAVIIHAARQALDEVENAGEGGKSG